MPRIALCTIKGIIREITKQISWVMSISLEWAIQNWLLSLTAYGWTEQRNLPSGYTQLDWITNWGDWYIDTWIIADVDDMEFDIVATINSSSNISWYVLQSRASSAANIYWISWSATGNTIIGAFSWTNIRVDNIVRSNWWKYHVNVKCKNGSITLTVEDLINETSETNTGTYTFTAWTTNIWLFSNMWGWNIPNWNTSVHSVYIKKSWVKVFEYTPCKNSSDVAWVYDNINWTFLPATNTAQWWSMVAWQNATPTPEAPMDIVSNNGVLKVSPNLFNKDSTPYRAGFYISSATVGNSSFGTTNNANYNIYRISIQPNTTYTFGIIKANAPYWVVMDDNTILDCAPNGGGTTGTTITITTPADAKYLYLSVGVNGTYKYDDILQLELGSTATPYIPYGQIYADGTVETINAHGKNLYNKADGVTGKILNDSGSIINENNGFYSANIPVSPNTTYAISQNSSTGGIYLRVLEYNNADTMVKLNKGTTAGAQDKTFTTSATTKYVIISGLNAGRDTLQLELGSSATTYEPYFNGGTATAEMLLKVGNYIDEQEILSWDITRKIWVKVLDWTEEWGTVTNNRGYYIRTDCTQTYYTNVIGLCSHFNYILWEDNTVPMPDNSFGFNKSSFTRITNGNITFKPDLTVYNTVDKFKQYLADQYAAGTPVIVVYPLATPTTETVAGQTMNIQAWSNTIEITQASIDDLELSAEYKALPSN